MSHIFVSYARPNSDFALKLASELRRQGVEIWLDQLDLRPGSRWDQTVEGALRACQQLLVILSPEATNSENVMDEVAFALEEGKTVIPVLYHKCEIPFRLRRVHFIDFTGEFQTAVVKLSGVLGATATIHDTKAKETILNISGTPTVHQFPKPITSRYPRVVAGLSAWLISFILLGIAFLIWYLNSTSPTKSIYEILGAEILWSIPVGIAFAITGLNWRLVKNVGIGWVVAGVGSLFLPIPPKSMPFWGAFVFFGNLGSLVAAIGAWLWNRKPPA